jgi:hypothetical protein
MLPMRERGIDALDVGAGPAPASLAAQDFYATVQTSPEIAESDSGLRRSPVRSHSCEASAAMIEFVNRFAEATRRHGPFRATYRDVESADPARERTALRESLRRDILTDEDATERTAQLLLHHTDTWWKDEYRYNLVLLSYVLTRVTSVASAKKTLIAIANALRPGGVLLVLGGVHREYPRIYRELNRTLRRTAVVAVDDIEEVLSTAPDDAAARCIRAFHTRTWSALGAYVDLKRWQKREIRDLFDPTAARTRAKSFGVRAFRRRNRPDPRRKRRRSVR